MSSAYLARSRICRRAAQVSHSAHVHTTKVSAIRSSAVNVPEGTSARRFHYRAWRPLNSSTSSLEAGAPPVADRGIAVAPEDLRLYDTEDNHARKPAFHLSQRAALSTFGTQLAPLISNELNQELFKAVLSLCYRRHGKSSFVLGKQESSDSVAAARNMTDASDAHMTPDTGDQTNPLFRIDTGSLWRVPAAAMAFSATSSARKDRRFAMHKVATREQSQLITSEVAKLLAKTPYTVKDAQKWADILTSASTRAAAQEYVEAVKYGVERGHTPLPIFVVLQILCAPSIPAREFRLLWKSVQEHIDVDLWDGNSAEILIFRGLHHARLVAPEALEMVVNLAREILLQRNVLSDANLTRCCNRFLRVIGAPAPIYPRRNILLQQAAQVRLIRYMMDRQRELPVTREGFRALVNVQLAHKKTKQETDWALAKALYWPPWRQDMLGMDARLTYPGRESRALKLLNRMVEAGYVPGSWEKAAKILAGWDTDGSPTIQTRQPLPTLMLKGDDDEFGAYADEEPIWAARITATRTIREAWAAFLTYRKQAVAASKELRSGPFEAMFNKLLASQNVIRPGSSVVPGDSKETWRDPTSEIDVIYVDKEPPTVEELYVQMRKDKVRPGMRLLATLLANTNDVDEGVKYIQNHMSERNRDVLLYQEKCGPELVRTTLQVMSPQFMAAFMYHLFSSKPEARHSYLATSSGHNLVDAGSREYAVELLEKSQRNERIVYIGALRGLLSHVRSGLVPNLQVRMHKSPDRILATCQSLQRLMANERVSHDFKTLSLTLELYHRVLRRGSWPRWFSVPRLVEFTKNTFAWCVQSKSGLPDWLQTESPLPLEAIPDPWHLRVVVETLGLLQDIEGLTQLTRWMIANMADFRRSHQHVRTADEQMQTVMIVARIFIDGWLEQAPDHQGHCMKAFDELASDGSEELHLPTVEDCAEYCSTKTYWVLQQTRYMKFFAQHAAAQIEREGDAGCQNHWRRVLSTSTLLKSIEVTQ